jgi:hypothetical protein
MPPSLSPGVFMISSSPLGWGTKANLPEVLPNSSEVPVSRVTA